MVVRVNDHHHHQRSIRAPLLELLFCLLCLVRGKDFSTYKFFFSVSCGYHVPGQTRLQQMSKPLLSSRLRFWKPCSGHSGDCHVWKLATDLFTSTFGRRILRGGYIAWRFLRGGTMASPARRSFDRSAEGAMTTARPPLSLTSCPCLSLLSTDYYLSPCCYILRRCSLTVRTLCLRREEWDHAPPAVTTWNSYLFVWYFVMVQLKPIRFVSY